MMKILIYADTQTVYVRDWSNLLSSNKDISIMLVCSTTDEIILPHEFPIRRHSSNVSFKKSDQLLVVVKKIRKYVLARHNSNWFESLLTGYRLLTLKKYARKLQKHIDAYQPDIIHAMRIPYEGIIASYCTTKKPIVLSIWGNDLTLHAASGGKKAEHIKYAIKRASAIHADAKRDIELLWSKYNFDQNKPYLVVPASGGLDTKNLRTDISKQQAKIKIGFMPDTTIVCNPRGFRSYIDTELYVQTCESLLKYTDNVVFMMVGADSGMKNWKYSEDASNNNARLIATSSLDIDRFRLLLRAIDIFVSPSYYDGMPVSLLEGMGSGVFPVLSDIDSVAGFVRHDRQGRLFKIDAPDALRNELLDIIKNVDLAAAAIENESNTNKEYSVKYCKPKIVSFYAKVSGHSKGLTD